MLGTVQYLHRTVKDFMDRRNATGDTSVGQMRSDLYPYLRLVCGAVRMFPNTDRPSDGGQYDFHCSAQHCRVMVWARLAEQQLGRSILPILQAYEGFFLRTFAKPDTDLSLYRCSAVYAKSRSIASSAAATRSNLSELSCFFSALTPSFH
jgi:hypothetical protein